MTVFESALTAANFTHSHIYHTTFRDKLPPDVFGGTDKNAPARRTIHLEFGSLHTDTFVTTDMAGKPRTFFQDRTFVGKFFEATGAEPGDAVLFQQVDPYHLKLSLRKKTGRLVTA